jgi:hypothetical protein
MERVQYPVLNVDLSQLSGVMLQIDGGLLFIHAGALRGKTTQRNKYRWTENASLKAPFVHMTILAI